MKKKLEMKSSMVQVGEKVNSSKFTELSKEEARTIVGGGEWIPWVPGYLQEEQPNPFWEGVPYKN